MVSTGQEPVPSYIVTKSNSAIWRDNSKQNTWTLNAYANYAKTFAKSHNLNVMVGANAEEVDYTYLYGYRKGLYDEAYPELNLAEPRWTANKLVTYFPCISRLFRSY